MRDLRAQSRAVVGRAVSLALAGAMSTSLAPACSQGEGEGEIQGTLDVPECWTGSFDLRPDYFAAVPYRDSLQLRIQKGSDFETFSDGVSILVHDASKVRPDPERGAPGTYGVPLVVDLPPEVTPPGVPVQAQADPANVSLTLYLQKTCRTQNVTLHAVREVSLPDGDACATIPLAGADPGAGCDPNTENPGGVGTGKSFLSFTHISNGEIDEGSASARLISGCFDVYLADPREIVPPAENGGPIAPPRCRGHVKGRFRFFFERGRPAQPFP